MGADGLGSFCPRASRSAQIAHPAGAGECKQAERDLSRAFALVVPHPVALHIRNEVAFFQSVQAALTERTPAEGRPSLPPRAGKVVLDIANICAKTNKAGLFPVAVKLSQAPNPHRTERPGRALIQQTVVFCARDRRVRRCRKNSASPATLLLLQCTRAP